MDNTKHESPVPKPTQDAVAAGHREPWGGAFDAIGEVFEQIKRNPVPLVIMMVAYAAAAALSVYLYGDAVGDPQRSTDWPSSIVSLLFLLAVQIYALALADKRSITPGDFFKPSVFKYVSIFFGSILAALMVLTAFLLLIVPVIWVLPWVALMTYIIVDQNRGPIPAIKESYRLTDDNKGKVWGVVGATVSLYFALLIMYALVSSLIGTFADSTYGFVFLNAGVAFLTVLSGGAMARLYRWLQTNVVKDAPLSPHVEPETESKS